MGRFFIFIGQFGNQIGLKVLTASDAPDFEDGKDCFLTVDTEQKVVASFKKKSFLRFDRVEEITAMKGRGCNWAMGYAEQCDSKYYISLKQKVVKTVQRKLERSHNLHGVIVIHSLIGGTGGGLGSSIIETLREEFAKIHITSITTSPFVSGESPLQHYNALLTLAWLQRFADSVMIFHNDDVMNDLSKASSRSTAISNPAKVSIDQMNASISSSIANLMHPFSIEGALLQQMPIIPIPHASRDANTSCLSCRSHKNASANELPLKGGRKIAKTSIQKLEVSFSSLGLESHGKSENCIKEKRDDKRTDFGGGKLPNQEKECKLDDLEQSQMPQSASSSFKGSLRNRDSSKVTGRPDKVQRSKPVLKDTDSKKQSIAKLRTGTSESIIRNCPDIENETLTSSEHSRVKTESQEDSKSRHVNDARMKQKASGIGKQVSMTPKDSPKKVTCTCDKGYRNKNEETLPFVGIGSNTYDSTENNVDDATQILQYLTPNPNLKFVSSYNKLSKEVTSDFKKSLLSILQKVPKTDLFGSKYKNAASVLIARGECFKMFEYEREEVIKLMKQKMCFANPMRAELLTSRFCAPGYIYPQSLTLLTNNSRNADYLDYVITKASLMYEHSAYLHWYSKFGCTSEYFEDAFETLASVVQEYRSL